MNDSNLYPVRQYRLVQEWQAPMKRRVTPKNRNGVRFGVLDPENFAEHIFKHKSSFMEKCFFVNDPEDVGLFFDKSIERREIAGSIHKVEITMWSRRAEAQKLFGPAAEEIDDDTAVTQGTDGFPNQCCRIAHIRPRHGPRQMDFNP
ncbi:hypothetical protein [Pararhizobium gei]|uniref:hypothetical protein n=1 Tax=Pararhizobium gei TaxID=1395951 RepID=UPI0023DBD653|nr:hypothetical protein [Rhizobium gei]